MQQSEPKPLKESISGNQFQEEPYRWIILIIGACAMILNGLLNNIFIPIANSLALIYEQSQKIVNLPIVISFLVFSLVNIPAGYFMDRKGPRAGYIIGLSIYVLGMFFVTLINSSFSLALLGYIIFSFGQPFIVNAPAEIATLWFLPKNRGLATSILVGAGIMGSGLGFALPTLVVGEDSVGQTAKKQIFSLYLGYAITTVIFLVLNIFFHKRKPSHPTSNIQAKEKLTLKQTYQHVKADKNIWKFLGAYWLILGSFQTFASSANLIIKPFGMKDIEISIAAILLIFFGATGAVLSSLYLKKTKQHKRIFRFCCLGALIWIIVLAVQLLLGSIKSILIQFNVGLLGFFITPIIPISYGIGCQIAFPIGEAQVTGLINGGSLIWAFISDSLLTLIIGFGSQGRSLAFVTIIILFISVGNYLCFRVRINLKKTQFQENKSIDSDSTRASTVPQKRGGSIEMQATQKRSEQEEGDDSQRQTYNDNPQYETLEEQKE